MAKSLRFVLGLLSSWALLVPIAFISDHWYIMVAVIFLGSITYSYNYKKSKKEFAAFLSALTFGIFFAVSFWVLLDINRWLDLSYDLYFLGSYFALFILTAWLILIIPKSNIKKLILVLLDLVAIAAFVLIVIYRQDLNTNLGLTLLMGALIGFVVSGLATSLFNFFVQQGSKIFGGLTDYIMLLLKPFMIFFLGYLCIAFIFAGIYNIILQGNPLALAIPERQIAFIDLVIYSLDTMTTGGNSEVISQTMLTQTVNTLNVFAAIIWMTVMLAATIAYTSESFAAVSKKHKENKDQNNETDPGSFSAV